MIVTKEDIMNLIFHKCFYGVAIGETKSKVVSLLGEPIHFQPQRKKNKEILLSSFRKVNYRILLYDGVNIYLYNSLVMEVSIDFSKSSLFKLKENISIHSIINILDDQCIEYKIELNEEGEYDFISFNSIQVGFLDNKLSYIWLS